MVVGADVVAVAGLVLRGRPQPAVRLKDADSGMHLAAPFAVQQDGVHVALAGALVQVQRQVLADPPHAVIAEPGDAAKPAARTGLMGPIGNPGPFLPRAAHRGEAASSRLGAVNGAHRLPDSPAQPDRHLQPASQPGTHRAAAYAAAASATAAASAAGARPAGDDQGHPGAPRGDDSGPRHGHRAGHPHRDTFTCIPAARPRKLISSSARTAGEIPGRLPSAARRSSQ